MYCKKLPSLSLLALIISAHNAQAAAPTEKLVASKEVEEVVVVARRESDYSVITEQAQQIIDVPGAMGDPLMAVFSLPGVLSTSEGGAPAVRGSSPWDNRYLVDGAPAGYVFHTFSTSIFNENIIQDFSLYSAGFGPSYSNAIGGVFDIKLRNPKHQTFTTKVDFSQIHAGVFFESEVSENSAFYLSARSSLVQYLIRDKDKNKIENEDGIKIQSVPEDTDYQFKYVYDVNAQNQLTLSANGATDLAAAEFTNLSSEVLEDPDFAGDAKIKQKFDNAMLSWQNKGDAGNSLNVKLGRYVHHADTEWGDDKYFFHVETIDNYVISTYETVLSDHNLSIGAEAHQTDFNYSTRYIQYICTETDTDCLFRRGELVSPEDELTINEGMLYVNDHWEVAEQVAVDLGVQGHYNDLTEETFVNPRVAVAWGFADDWTLSSSLGKYNRLPEIDKLFPEVGNPDLKSPTSNHFTLGLKETLNDGWSWSLTSYYKTMDNLPLAKDINKQPGNDIPVYTNDVEGKAYGVDLLVNKEITDRWYGWVSISASKSLRTNKLTQIENDYYLDTPLVVNWVTNYMLTDKWTVGTNVNVHTGRAYTPIIGVQPNPYFDNHILPVYGEAYSKNLPTYVRLDLRVKRDANFGRHQGNYTLDIYNLLNRENVTNRNLDYKRTTSPQNFTVEDQKGRGIMLSAGVSITF